MAHYLYVYPPNSNDPNHSKVIFISNDTLPEDLQKIVCLEFGLPPDTDIAFQTIIDDRLVIIPVSSIKQYILSQPSNDVAVRIKCYDNDDKLFSEYENSDIENDEYNDESWENEQYFMEYSRIGIHWNMLKDKARCETYNNAVQLNKKDFEGKVVLDVGCGTGILSCFAARAGAKKVYAVEASDMYKYAMKVVESNHFSDIIEVIHGRIEAIDLPEKVDIIISEWMGIFLLYESMLNSVIRARDKWLKEDGLMFPCEANMYLSPIVFDKWFEDRISVFDKVCDIDLSSLVPFARKSFTESCLKGCDDVNPEHIISDGILIKHFDLKTVTEEDLKEFTYDFKFDSLRKDYCHGFCTWFDVTFKGSSNEPLVLSTSPFKLKTHWKQDVFLLEDRIDLNENQEISGTIRAKQMKMWKRHYKVYFNIKVEGKEITKKYIL